MCGSRCGASLPAPRNFRAASYWGGSLLPSFPACRGYPFSGRTFFLLHRAGGYSPARSIISLYQVHLPSNDNLMPVRINGSPVAFSTNIILFLVSTAISPYFTGPDHSAGTLGAIRTLIFFHLPLTSFNLILLYILFLGKVCSIQ